MNPQTNTFSKQNIKVLILAGGYDFGRCALATSLPVPLWPLNGRASIEHLLENLADQEIKHVVILPGPNQSFFTKSLQMDNRIEIEYLVEPLPVGTAGSIREAGKDTDKSLFILLPASMICPPDIDLLINEHIKGNADLTVVLETVNSDNCEREGQACGIFICERSVLELIPQGGYSDIKEGLIPKMLQAGRNVHAVTLSHRTGNFRDCREYLQAVSNNIEGIAKLNNTEHCESNDLYNLWTGAEVKINPSARIAGNVILMDNVHISEGAVVIGPSVIGKNVTVGKNSVVVNSIVWDNSVINSNCYVEHSILDYNSHLYSHANITGNCIASGTRETAKVIRGDLKNTTKKRHKTLQHISVRIKYGFHKIFGMCTQKNLKYLAPLLLSIAFLWSYWAGIRDLWNIWLQSDEYSSGLLVPFIAGYIIWLRRKEILSVPVKPSIWGLFLFILAQAMRLFGLFFLFGSAERISIVFSIAAIVLLLFGWKLLMKVSTVILFLFLMLPWPNRIHAAVSLPLQQVSTASAVFCLEVLGFDILREGNVIHIGNAVVAVAEACNGLRMITAFFVITGLVALLVNRTWWEKLIVLISSVPVAFLCNTLRLAITAIIFTWIKGPYWEKIFHDFGGYAMMPLALGFIVGELWLIDKLTIVPEEKKEIIIERQKR
ncbi:MAG: exosortase [Sedimentisphaerales bacterium]|nr:exosortase [Sedimentisphaerales bacterium]